MIEHIFRRGFHTAHAMHGMMADSDGGDDKPVQVSPVALLVLFATSLVFILLIFSVSCHDA